MFLATTARTDFWDTSQPMLFLGEWCLRRDRVDDWKHLERRVLPCPWDDRAAFHRAAESLDAYGERLLPALTEFLNSLHAVKHDVRYWRVLVGAWLLHALHVYYDRWVGIREALRLQPDLTTIVLDRADHRHAVSSNVWERLTMNDEFNLQLYSEVFAALGYDFPARRMPAESSSPSPGLHARVRNAAFSLMSRSGASAARAMPRSVLFHQAVGYLTAADAARLIVASGFRVWPFDPSDDLSSPPPTEKRRAEITEFPARDEFEIFFVRRLSQMLPTAVTEQYESKRRLARTVRFSGVIASFSGWYSSDSFRFTAAEAYARGARLIAVQHGGGYGMLRAAPAEWHERRVSDRFLAWGWGDERKHPCVTNVPAATLARFRGISRARTAPEAILFLATEHPRYLYRFHSTPVASQWERYYEWQIRFFDAVPAELRPHMRFRGNPYASDFGQGQYERIASRFPWLQFDDEARLRDSLRRARLVVADHHGTSFIQVLAAGVPMVLFFDPELWELQAEAEEPFGALRRGGILFDDPESAAAAAARRYNQADDWWSSTAAETARARFMNHFALDREDWTAIWSRALCDVTRRPTEVQELREVAS